MKVNTGISAEDRKRLSEGLSRILADSYTLYLKTQSYHWNVEGPHFKGLHDLFEEQYTDLAAAVDELAERIRALGHKAPGSFSSFSKLAAVKEDGGDPDWKAMIRNLAEDQETVIGVCREVLKLSQETEDAVTEDMLAGRLTTHEKNAWMLRSHLA